MGGNVTRSLSWKVSNAFFVGCVNEIQCIFFKLLLPWITIMHSISTTVDYYTPNNNLNHCKKQQSQAIPCQFFLVGAHDNNDYHLLCCHCHCFSVYEGKKSFLVYSGHPHHRLHEWLVVLTPTKNLHFRLFVYVIVVGVSSFHNFQQSCSFCEWHVHAMHFTFLSVFLVQMWLFFTEEEKIYINNVYPIRLYKGHRKIKNLRMRENENL